MSASGPSESSFSPPAARAEVSKRGLPGWLPGSPLCDLEPVTSCACPASLSRVSMKCVSLSKVLRLVSGAKSLEPGSRGHQRTGRDGHALNTPVRGLHTLKCLCHSPGREGRGRWAPNPPWGVRLLPARGPLRASESSSRTLCQLGVQGRFQWVGPGPSPPPCRGHTDRREAGTRGWLCVRSVLPVTAAPRNMRGRKGLRGPGR